LYIVPVAPGSLFRLELLAQQLCIMHSIVNDLVRGEQPIFFFLYFLGKTSKEKILKKPSVSRCIYIVCRQIKKKTLKPTGLYCNYTEFYGRAINQYHLQLTDSYTVEQKRKQKERRKKKHTETCTLHGEYHGQRIYSIRIPGSGRDDLKRAHRDWFFMI
jgi:hypothetical protein